MRQSIFYGTKNNFSNELSVPYYKKSSVPMARATPLQEAVDVASALETVLISWMIDATELPPVVFVWALIQ